MIKTKQVYIVTAFFRDYEEMNYTSPSENYFAETYEEAQKMKAELEQDYHFDDIVISESPEEKEMIIK